MLDEKMQTELKAIAFNKEEKPADIVSACAILARNKIEFDKVVLTLKNMAIEGVAPSKVRIKAIDLLDKIVVEEKDNVVKIENTKEAEENLLKEYGIG